MVRLAIAVALFLGTLSVAHGATLRLAPVLSIHALPSGSDALQRKYMVTYRRRCADRVEGLFTTHLGGNPRVVLGVAVRSAPADKCTARDSVETLPLTLPVSDSSAAIEFLQPEEGPFRPR